MRATTCMIVTVWIYAPHLHRYKFLVLLNSGTYVYLTCHIGNLPRYGTHLMYMYLLVGGQNNIIMWPLAALIQTCLREVPLDGALAVNDQYKDRNHFVRLSWNTSHTDNFALPLFFPDSFVDNRLVVRATHNISKGTGINHCYGESVYHVTNFGNSERVDLTDHIYQPHIQPPLPTTYHIMNLDNTEQVDLTDHMPTTYRPHTDCLY